MPSVSFRSAWYKIEEIYDAKLVSFSKALLQLLEYELLDEEEKDDFTILDDESALKIK